jgi:ABC-type transport system involved in cytochrome c biogenesis permease subunit
MNPAKTVPWIAAALALGGAGAALLPSGSIRGFDVEGFGALPVLEGGRVKPLDSVARNSLLMIRSQQSFTHQGRSIGADEWLLDVMFRPDWADAEPVFVINDPEVLGLIGLKQTSERYFPFATLGPHLEEIERQAMAAQQIDAKERTRFQGSVLNLFSRVNLYYRLENTLQISGGPGLLAEIAARNEPEAKPRIQEEVGLAVFRPFAPPPGAKADAWRSVGEALGAADLDPALDPFARIAAAYRAQDPALFRLAVADARAQVALRRPEALRQANSETLFNRAQPFYLGMVIYLLALLTLFVSWIWKPAILQPTSYALLLSGAFVHTTGLLARMLLQGRPPVTNLYSSAIFVGWSAVIVGIVLERIYRRGFGTAVAASSGFASLIIAHHLAGDGDTMEMMRAVLDSNIWLATHVVSITIGYSGTFLAGALAIAYVARYQLAPRLDPGTTKTLVSMTYGVICFALFFSFVGTVLGGIWADQSWGRFWGWDPKENGALLIVLWNAIILHARWGGIAKERGLMAMAIFGNIITSLSWFGVNMLGVGLHSYGFMESAFWALASFIATQLVLIGIALLPRQFWKSRARRETPAPAAGAPAAR